MKPTLWIGCVLLWVGVVSVQAAKPNIVLCMADDQGWGDMGHRGHPVVKTPHLDAMAKAGLRFDRFYSAAPVCSPTRGSVLTGRHPNRYGILNHGRSIRPQETTIAEALKTAGYVTGHFGKWHVGSVQKTSPVNPGASGFDEWLSAPNFFDLNPILSRNGVAVQCKGDSSMIAVDAAIEFMRKHAKGEQPFLTIVWFASPHSPHQALPQDQKLYGRAKMAGYWREITSMDRAFGKLRKEIRNLGIHENTILWYCSDNGGLDEATSGGRGKKGVIYEGGLRVPGMIEWPARIPKPRVTDVPAMTSDIYPTLLEIVGVRVPGQLPLDGISLVGVLDGKMTTRPKPMGFWRTGAPGRSTRSDLLMAALLKAQKAGKQVGDRTRLDLDAAKITRQVSENSFPEHAAWNDWPWKLHRIQAGKGGKVTLELYNLVEDAGEKKNVLSQNADRAKTMRADLEAWLQSVARSLNGKDYK